MSAKTRYLPIILTVYMAFVFLQSLFYKFTNDPETVYIFGTLNEWAGTLGAHGIFSQTGLFSQYVIGTGELLASSLLLLALLPNLRVLRPVGAGLSMAIMSGAIFFHLFTPLGVSVKNDDGTHDGGLLFGMACGVWISGLILLTISGPQIAEIRQRLFGPAPKAM